MEQVQNTIISFFQTLFPSDIWNLDYFVELWGEYACFWGIVFGASILIMAYFARYSEEYEERNKVMEVLRVLAAILLINLFNSIYIIYMDFVNTVILDTGSTSVEKLISGAFNPLSILIIVLVISDRYREKAHQVFFFGMSVFSVSMLLYGLTYTSDYLIIYSIIRVVMASALCVICSKTDHIFISYMMMEIFFIVTEIIRDILISVGEVTLASFEAEIIFIILGAVIIALFEIFILTKGKFNLKKTVLIKPVISLGVIVIVTIVLSYADYNIFAAEDENSESYEEVSVSSAESSSFLTAAASGKEYTVDLTIDGSEDTCWQEGQDGDGTGETLTYYFDSDTSLAKISIINGNAESEEEYYNNNRLEDAVIEMYLDGELVAEQDVHFEDSYSTNAMTVTLDESVTCDEVIIRVTDVYEGSVYNDLCVTEVSFKDLEYTGIFAFWSN